MKVEVQYVETYVRKGEVTIDETEFLAWVNEGEGSYKTVDEVRGQEDMDELLKEFLEGAGEHAWAVAPEFDPFVPPVVKTLELVRDE